MRPLFSRRQGRALRHDHNVSCLAARRLIAQTPSRQERIIAPRPLPSGEQDLQTRIQAPVLQGIIEHHCFHIGHIVLDLFDCSHPIRTDEHARLGELALHLHRLIAAALGLINGLHFMDIRS